MYGRRREFWTFLGFSKSRRLMPPWNIVVRHIAVFWNILEEMIAVWGFFSSVQIHV